MNTNEDSIAILRDIRKWIKASSYGAVHEMLKTVLKDERLRLIYQITDGSRGRDQVKEIAKVGATTVTDTWDTCVAMGLMEQEGTRRIRAFDLRDFGLITTDQVEAALSAAVKPKTANGDHQEKGTT